LTNQAGSIAFQDIQTASYSDSLEPLTQLWEASAGPYLSDSAIIIVKVD